MKFSSLNETECYCLSDDSSDGHLPSSQHAPSLPSQHSLLAATVTTLPSVHSPPSQHAPSLPSQHSLFAATVTTLPSVHSPPSQHAPSLPSQHSLFAATVTTLPSVHSLPSQHELLATEALLSQQEPRAATALLAAVFTQQPFWPQHLHVQSSHGQTPVSTQQVPSTQQGPQSPVDAFVREGSMLVKPFDPLRLAAPAIAATVATKATKAIPLLNFFIVIFLLDSNQKLSYISNC